MKPLDRVSVAIVGGLPPRSGDLLEGAGATVFSLSPEEFWAARDPAYDVIVLGDLPRERTQTFVRELRGDARARAVPRLALVADADAAWRIVRAGPVALLDARASDGELVAAVEELASARRAASDARAAKLESDVRELARELDEQRRHRSTLAHDLRVLLAVTLGFACNLRDGFVGTLDDEQRASVERIVAATEDATALLGAAPPPVRAREVPSVPPRRMPQRSQVAVDGLVRDVVALFEDTARDSGVTLEARAVEPQVAWCDPVQIKQALVNLVVNALKFTPEGGRVELTVERSEPALGRGRDRRSRVRVIVADSGPGVPDDERERIFRRGARLHRDEGIPGHGIGLSVVKEIAASHHGTVEVGSGPLGGASFVITLPVDLRRRRRTLRGRT